MPESTSSAEPRTIIYTLTDEAPALATRSLLPIIRAFTTAAGVEVETRDLSLAGRILAAFPDRLTPDRRVPDDLAELGALVQRPEANIIKLPNISASVPQMKAAIAELQAKGHDLPDYPDEPSTPDEHETRSRYDRVKGSAVNPVLRQGNSDRRAPASVKRYARSHPQRMGAWSPDSRTHVAHMTADDFRSNERSVTVGAPATLRVELHADDGSVTVLKDSIPVAEGEIVDATVMRVAALRRFLDEQLVDAKAKGVLFSLHLKATMMKVSDPIMFGHAVSAYLGDVLDVHADVLDEIGADPDQGLGAVLERIEALPDERRAPIIGAIQAAMADGPAVAMVDSDRGITNLHVPSDVIIDASMPPMIRDSGQMWNAAGELQDTKAVIPDSSYAGIYAVVIDDCKGHGAFDPATMGSVANVGLMAQQAEEYGSHDKTFEVPHAGVVRVVDDTGATLLEHRVGPGDIWRACQTTDAAIRDWVRLAVARARATRTPAVFWLDETRAHDAQVLVTVRDELAGLDTANLDRGDLTIEVRAPEDAMRFTLERVRAGQDTISVTGNVLRDYLTDLFPILELGTSAKMLSIVPLMAGGALFETGAGGSAPKHVQQLVQEGHLRWDSLGEFLALQASLEHLADRTGDRRAAALAASLDAAVERILEEGRSPKRKVHELGNRTSHVDLARFWAAALADQADDPDLAARFAPLARALEAEAATIFAEIDAVQGHPADLGGYYRPDEAKADAVMRPSTTFNRILAEA
jgi:isocitrate dehydrogenase